VALCQARISTKPLWGFSSSNPYHSQSRAEQPEFSNEKLIEEDRFRIFCIFAFVLERSRPEIGSPHWTFHRKNEEEARPMNRFQNLLCLSKSLTVLSSPKLKLPIMYTVLYIHRSRLFSDCLLLPFIYPISVPPPLLYSFSPPPSPLPLLRHVKYETLNSPDESRCDGVHCYWLDACVQQKGGQSYPLQREQLCRL
jgi:hypothetical protein